MEFADVIRLIGRRWIVVVLVTLLGGVAGFAGAILLTPSYESEVNLLFDRETPAEAGGASQDLLQRMPTFAALTTTATVLDPVAERVSYPGGVRALREKVTAVAPDSTLLLRITVTDPEPARAARLADAVAGSYAEAVRDDFGAGAQGDRVVVTTVQPGTIPAEPAWPSVPLFVAAGAVAGLVIVVLVLLTVTTVRRTRPE
ncbi:YveK family protein [Amycolatopsis cihanbeyliensis]|uniref:Capsular polysaccharide biosynthesis protein n=1 Tax=Amycolatopsis cihanbeyliensis TaxID=1128664 RepID=A0A542DNR3_AMYCI|nr:hypothetical protein [Amycolatopsis cihanbeyliensis]TQJ04743.1 capsular polysaccharide biosynthesis protein [Amycolatopsis cihanbeyliensis]